MDEQMQKLAEKVAGKIHWETPEREVCAWLKEEKNIPHELAEKFILERLKERRGEVRQRAMIRLVVAGIGMLAFGALSAVSNSAAVCRVSAFSGSAAS